MVRFLKERRNWDILLIEALLVKRKTRTKDGRNREKTDISDGGDESSSLTEKV